MASSLVTSSALVSPLQKPRLISLNGNRSLRASSFFASPRAPSLRFSPKFRVSASAKPSVAPSPNVSPDFGQLMTDSTRTVTSLAALAFAVSKIFLNSIKSLAEKIIAPPSDLDLSKLKDLKGSLMCSVGPLFFAALRDRPRGDLNTPLTVVAAGLARWLEIYSGVLMIRVLLSWFPNIPWQRQPLSAIRDLCDPYLNLFRNIIPPIFDALDVSPLLAFAVLGTLSSILNSSKGGY